MTAHLKTSALKFQDFAAQKKMQVFKSIHAPVNGSVCTSQVLFSFIYTNLPTNSTQRIHKMPPSLLKVFYLNDKFIFHQLVLKQPPAKSTGPDSAEDMVQTPAGN